MNKQGTEANYIGTHLPNCDFCSMAGTTKEAAYDGATVQGPWGYMCEHHFQQYGLGLGLGRGQKLLLVNPA